MQDLSNGDKLKNASLIETIERRKKLFAGYKLVTPAHEFGVYVKTPLSEPLESKSSLSGIGSSGGKVRGIARILADMGDLEKFVPGEILVTQFTDPGWTPVLARAGAVVTEVGGMLSHAAVISREFGIPAVLNVDGATRLIRNGQEIIVDGDGGKILLEF